MADELKILTEHELQEKLNDAYDLGYQSCLNYKGLSWKEAEELQRYRENAVVLPCKVGEKLYSVDGKTAEVEEFLVDKRGISMTVSFECDHNCEECAFNSWRQEYCGEYSCDGEWGEMTIPATELGKSLFRTYEEAKAELWKRRGNNAND